MLTPDTRRKKSKCPGEQPVCSHCARLNQECTYISTQRVSRRLSETPAIDARSESSIDGPPGMVCLSESIVGGKGLC
jgi:Fungal Zn(2)-Cys(6) binuclear cluster domain